MTMQPGTRPSTTNPTWVVVALALLVAMYGCRPAAPEGYWTTCSETEACQSDLECVQVERTTSLVCTMACDADSDCPVEEQGGASSCVKGFCERSQEGY